MGLIIATVLIANTAMHMAEQSLRNESQTETRERSDAIAARVDRLRHLTTAIAGHPHVRKLLAKPSSTPDHSLQDSVNAYLETLAAASGASLLYVINTDALTRASSNHAMTGSLVGNEYSYRPYFIDAMAGQEARYYAVGATTGVAGYYFARPVYSDTGLLGIAVVKVELETLQQDWAESGESLLLIDEHGVTIAANPSTLRFRATRPLSAQTLAEFKEQRKYAQASLSPLDARLVDPQLRTDSNDANDPLTQARRIELGGRIYIVAADPLPDQDWHLLHLSPDDSIRAAGLRATLACLLLIGLSSLCLLYLRERARRALLSRESHEAARMRLLNTQLEAEVADRRRAETELRETQNELVQASKLAALGQMSAAVAHEVNQPLSAIRTFSASARLLLDRKRTEEVRKNLIEIEELTERLAMTTSELKVFSRKPDDAQHPLDITHCVLRTVDRIRLQSADTALSIDAPEEPILVSGNAFRLEQVIGNLLTNAIDATIDNIGARRVDISLHIDTDTQPHESVLRIADNGTGLDDEALEHLFDPFFTTKPVGQGVGLGLAISYGIVQEMGGRLLVRNLEDGGALFSLRLAIHEQAAQP